MSEARPARVEESPTAPEPVEPLVLTGLVVHWGAPQELARLLEHWPTGDPQRPLIVLDNDPSPATADLARQRPDVRFVTPGSNLGFAGGLARAFEEARAAPRPPGAVLVLNPDVVPEKGALTQIERALQAFPEAAAVAPRLLDEDGSDQCAWQLRPLPGLRHLIVQCLYRPGVHGPKQPPPKGSPVEQPAAAVLALRSEVMDELGGFDPLFYPAWFEDVDFARRARERGLTFRYWPEARFHHSLGSSVSGLGYDVFLWVFFRSLDRYVGRHHGAAARLLTRSVLVLSSAARIVLLGLHRPRRASSRREAARGFMNVASGAITGFRVPRRLAQRFAQTRPAGARAGGGP